MALPDVTLDIQDGALGIVPDSTDNIVLKVGTASQGPTDQVQSFTRIQDVVSTYGSGPLVEAAALSLATAGGPILCLRIPSTVAGASSAVTHTGTGTAVMTVSGTPVDEFEVQVTVTRAAANLAANAAAFTYSLDGGETVSQEVALPVGGTYAVPNTGLTLTFADGTFVVADIYAFTSTAPGYALSDLQAAMATALADPREWGAVHVVGAAASASAAAAICAAMDTILSSAAESYRFAFALVEFPTDTDANLLTAIANTTSKRVVPCAGTATILSPVTGLEEKRSSAWLAAARVAKVPISEDLGRVATGPVTGVTTLQRDEQVTPGLESKFTTLRTIIGRAGFYITSGRLMSPAGSDFDLVQKRRVMDRACKVARNALLTYLNSSLVLQDATGKNPGAVDERQARAIEADVNAQLAAALTGHVTKAYVLVDRTHSVSADATLPVSVRVQPLGYARFITVDIGFTAAA